MARWRLTVRGRDGQFHEATILEAETREEAYEQVRRSRAALVLAFDPKDYRLEPVE